MASKQIEIVEVGPRDGLQNEKKWVDTPHKLQFIRDLVDAGLTHIELTSFVRAPKIPQMRDAKEVLREALQYNYQGIYTVLVPNLHGLSDLREVLDTTPTNNLVQVAVFITPSETFSQKNTNASVKDALTRTQSVIEACHRQKLTVRGYISCCFVCPYEGAISPDKVATQMQWLFDSGVAQVSLGDTIGAAYPHDVEALLLHQTVNKYLPQNKTSLHFHDTFHRAIDNVERALELGVTSFDASTGGIGGCPYAPGAKGNLDTVKLLNKLTTLGFETSVDLKKIHLAAATLRGHLETADEIL